MEDALSGTGCNVCSFALMFWLPQLFFHIQLCGCVLTHTAQNRTMISYRTMSWSPATRNTEIPEN